jgi:hypothetical protein
VSRLRNLERVAIAVLSFFAFIGLNGFATDLVLPVTTNSFVQYSLYELLFVSTPAIVVIGAFFLLGRGPRIPCAAIAAALIVRSSMSLSLNSAAPLIQQLVVELVGLAVAFFVVRLIFSFRRSSPARAAPASAANRDPSVP